MAREREVGRYDSAWYLRQRGCGWTSPLSRRTPPAPGTPWAAFPRHCPLPPGLARSPPPPCSGIWNSPWPSPSPEVVDPSTWRPPPFGGESRAGTWTAAGGGWRVLQHFFGGAKKNVLQTYSAPYFGPHPWRSIFIDHKRTQVEITQPEEDVKRWTCVKHKVETLWWINLQNVNNEQISLKSNYNHIGLFFLYSSSVIAHALLFNIWVWAFTVWNISGC